MTYRILPPVDWPRLWDITQRNGITLPDPEIATAAVAEDEAGEIVGVLFLQIAIHMEPMIIEQSGVNFLRMVETLEDHARPAVAGKGTGYYAMSGTPKIARMCEKAGMQLTPYALWTKEIE